jgi:hypothetical protein
MDKSNHPRRADRTVRHAGLLVTRLLLTASAAGCADQADRSEAPAAPASTTTAATTAASTTTAAAAATTASTAATVRLPSPIREVQQGDRVFGVYWVAASSTQLAPVERRLRSLGYRAASGDLDCDRGARRGLGVPAAITAKVAVYFGTEQDARAFAEGVEVQPRPSGHAAAILYCLD